MDALNIAKEYDSTQYIVIKIGEEQYGIDIKYVDNILRMQHITRVPKVANYIKGVINLRGSVLPVIDLKKRLGLQDTEYTDDTRIVIVKDEDIEVGMIVDAVSEVITLDSAHIDTSKAVDNESNRFITGIGKLDDRLIIMLNLSEIIGLSDDAK